MKKTSLNIWERKKYQQECLRTNNIGSSQRQQQQQPLRQ